MANIPLNDVPHIQEDALFADGSNVRLNVSNEFRQFAMALFRNALSKAMLHAEARDPADSELVTGLTQYWINTSSGARFISISGADWVDVTPSAQLSDEQLQDKIDAFLVAGDNVTLTYDDDAGTLTIAATGTGSSGLTIEQVRDAIASFIQGGTNVSVVHDDDSDTLTIAATDTNTQLTDEEFQDKLNSLITAGANITITYDDAANTFTIAATGNGGGLAAVASDDTLQGDGTSGSPLGVVGLVPLTEAERAPRDADKIENVSQVWLDTERRILWVSYEGGDWSPAVAEGNIGDGMYISDWDIDARSSATQRPAAGHILYHDDGFYIHPEDTAGTARGIHLIDLREGDWIVFTDEDVYFEVSAAPTLNTGTPNFYEIEGDWRAGDRADLDGLTMVSFDIIHRERAIGLRAIQTHHIMQHAITLEKLARGTPGKFAGWDDEGNAEEKDAPEGSAAVALNIGGIISLGEWTRAATSDVDATFSSGSSAVSLSKQNSAGTTLTDVLSGLESGDTIAISLSRTATQGEFVLDAAPTVSQYAVNFSGDWRGTDPTLGSGTTYYFYAMKRNNRIVTKNFRRRGYTLSVADDLQLEYQEPQQPDEFFSSEDMDIGVFQTLGDFAWTSTSLPATGQYYVSATELKVFEADDAGTDVGTPLSNLGVGDRIQIGTVNVFVLTAAGVRTNNGVWTFAGDWGDTYTAGDFSGTDTIYHIASENVVIRNTAVPGRFVEVSDSLMLKTRNPADSLETIWEGEFTAATTEVQMLNAGKKFSDYTDVIFSYSGRARRNHWPVNVDVWDAEGNTEFSNGHGQHLAVTHRGDREFQLAGGGVSITLYRIYGYKGV